MWCGEMEAKAVAPRHRRNLGVILGRFPFLSRFSSAAPADVKHDRGAPPPYSCTFLPLLPPRLRHHREQGVACNSQPFLRSTGLGRWDEESPCMRTAWWSGDLLGIRAHGWGRTTRLLSRLGHHGGEDAEYLRFLMAVTEGALHSVLPVRTSLE